MADGFGTKPQFDTAEFNSASNACAFCKTAISAGYYKVQGKLTCANCFQKIRSSIPQDSHAAFVKAVIFGSVAALVGMAAYAGVVIATGWTIGYLALGVGYIIAKAMMKGSGNVGGRRYQIVAVLLTYAAISMAAVPIALSGYFKEGRAEKAAHSSQSSTQPSSGSQADSAGSNGNSPAESANGKSLLQIAGTLIALGLASPFLEFQSPGHGIIGAIILFIGLRIAWQLSAGSRNLSIEGPY